MNVRLEVVINDITGKTGRAIIEAILEGERNGKRLRQWADARIKKSKAEIAQALEGHWEAELRYERRDGDHLYQLLEDRIKAGEKRWQHLLEEFTEEVVVDPEVKLTKKQTKGKNQPKFDLPTLS
ncbi:MAG: hypothetical protein AAF600_01760 [Bacteroidota bacterium]